MRLRAAALLAGILLSSGAARAQDASDPTVLTGTLKTLYDRGTILIGVRDRSIPFAFMNRAHQPVGMSVDLCHAIAEDAAAALHVDLLEPDAPSWQSGLRIVYVPVAADERMAKVTSGAIDLECGSTTANAERARTAAFSPVFFLAGTKLMVPVEADGRSRYGSWRELAGKTIAVSSGTTNAAVIERLAKQTTPPITVAEVGGLEPAYAMLVAGKADAFASDDILLTGMIATHQTDGKFRVIGEYLSFEPYAIMLRRDDPAFAQLVQASFARMAAEGRLTALYDRWLVDRLPTGERLDLPMSAQLAEMYRALGQPD